MKATNLQRKTKGKGSEPACIKEWAALTTWLRMNLHQACCVDCFCELQFELLWGLL